MIRKFLLSSIPFYLGITLLIIVELLINYLLRPFPGSQTLDSIHFVYFLYHFKIYFTVAFLLFISIGILHFINAKKKLIAFSWLFVCAIIFVLTNFIYTAQKRFPTAQHSRFESEKLNEVEKSKMVVLIENEAEAKAYPMPYIMYHHQVLDTFQGKSIIVTYCPMCQTGRVYESYINNVYSKFRLVGVNHGNAMFEDDLTKSWWSQETGECLVGKLKGMHLKNIPTKTLTLEKSIAMCPNVTIMQPEPNLRDKYQESDFYNGLFSDKEIPKGRQEWHPKTFVVGVKVYNSQKAYAWSHLKKVRIINDSIGDKSIIICLAMDNKSFVVYENKHSQDAILHQDLIKIDNQTLILLGKTLI